MPLDAYLELLDWTARQIVPGKHGFTPQDTPPHFRSPDDRTSSLVQAGQSIWKTLLPGGGTSTDGRFHSDAVRQPPVPPPESNARTPAVELVSLFHSFSMAAGAITASIIGSKLLPRRIRAIPKPDSSQPISPHSRQLRAECSTSRILFTFRP